MKIENNDNFNAYKTGYYSSIFLSVITFITFGFALTAIPIAGEFCPGNCIEYPYLETVQQFPKDYIWMFFAMFLISVYLINMVSLHYLASLANKIFSKIGLCFAILSSVILLSCYFIQFSVIPASLMNNETEGIALLTQYNPHGVFIAMEELGYLMMSLSFLFIAFIFTKNNRLEKSIRLIYIIAFILTLVAFSIVTIKQGIIRMDRFEVIVISIDWLTLIVTGILSSIIFKRKIKTNNLIH